MTSDTTIRGPHDEPEPDDEPVIDEAVIEEAIRRKHERQKLPLNERGTIRTPAGTYTLHPEPDNDRTACANCQGESIGDLIADAERGERELIVAWLRGGHTVATMAGVERLATAIESGEHE